MHCKPTYSIHFIKVIWIVVIVIRIPFSLDTITLREFCWWINHLDYTTFLLGGWNRTIILHENSFKYIFCGSTFLSLLLFFFAELFLIQNPLHITFRRSLSHADLLHVSSVAVFVSSFPSALKIPSGCYVKCFFIPLSFSRKMKDERWKMKDERYSSSAYIDTLTIEALLNQ